jgi:hypothetical protein
VTARLGPDASTRLAAQAAAADDDEGDGAEPSALALIKSVPGNVSLESMLTEIGKLDAARTAGLPDGLFSPGSRRRWSPPGGPAPWWRRRRTCVTIPGR